MKAEKKKRTDKVRAGDRNVEKRVHQGKGYIKVLVTNERARGKKWGEFVKTRKPSRGVVRPNVIKAHARRKK
jgi:ribosomal protein S19